MALTYSKANSLLNELNGNGSVIYVGLGLSTSNPSRDGTGVNEPDSSKNYARVRLTGMTTPSNGETENGSLIYFPEPSSSWGTISYLCLFSGSTGNNLVAWGELESSITPVAEKIPVIRVGKLKISM